MADLVGADGDAQPGVCLVQQDRLDQLVGHPILEVLLVFFGELSPRLAARLVVGGLIRLLPLGVVHFLPVDLQHHVARRPTRPPRDAHADIEDQPSDESDGQNVELVFRHFPHGAHHGRGTPS